jgi:hypothetical protein
MEELWRLHRPYRERMGGGGVSLGRAGKWRRQWVLRPAVRAEELNAGGDCLGDNFEDGGWESFRPHSAWVIAKCTVNIVCGQI